MFLHQLKNVQELFEVVASEKDVLPYLVEKDYWIMHALWGLKHQGFQFDLKGGTSLSKGYGIIHRFSEDLDIKIFPDDAKLRTGKNHNEVKDVQARKAFFERLVSRISIPDMSATRDFSYDDSKMRNGGINLAYKSFFPPMPGIKLGVLLEVGFDQTTPNEKLTISSWAYQKCMLAGTKVDNNQADEINCYYPEYTFVEKLQTLSTKVRKQQEDGKFVSNFMRHFYDVYQLLQEKRIISFIGSAEYYQHKKERFRTNDELDIEKNIAFNLDKEPTLYQLYRSEFERIRPLFFDKAPNFDDVYADIIAFRNLL